MRKAFYIFFILTVLFTLVAYKTPSAIYIYLVYNNRESRCFTALVGAFVNVMTTCFVVQFYPWFKFYFHLFLGMVMYYNEFTTKADEI